jgi:putative transposase
MHDGFDEPIFHRGHRSIRCQGYDYSSPGLYFVTICTHEKRCVLGGVIDGRVKLSAIGQIVREFWLAIPSHSCAVTLHEFVVMPNHLHGIIEIVAELGHGRGSPQLTRRSPTAPNVVPGSLGAIGRSFKAAVTKRAHVELQWPHPVWQRNYFERVLRDGREYADAARYVAENTLKWEFDRENPTPRRGEF